MAKVQLEIRGSREFVWHVGDRVSLFGMSRGAISAKLLEILLGSIDLMTDVPKDREDDMFTAVEQVFFNLPWTTEGPSPALTELKRDRGLAIEIQQQHSILFA